MIQDSNNGANHDPKISVNHDSGHSSIDNSSIHSKDESMKEPGMDSLKTNKTDDSESAQSIQKVKIEFPYSDVARAAVPKAFDVAETVATQWVHNQKFENLGLANPLAEFAAVKTLEKAKEVEKKLEEKGLITAAKMGVEIAKLQAQSFLQKWKK